MFARFKDDNSMMDGGEVGKYFDQLKRIMQRLLRPIYVEHACWTWFSRMMILKN